MSSQVDQDIQENGIHSNIKEDSLIGQEQNQNQQQNIGQASESQYKQNFIQEKLDLYSEKGESNQNTVTLNTSTLENQNQFIPQQNINELADNTNEASSQLQASQMQQYIKQMASQNVAQLGNHSQDSQNSPHNANQQKSSIDAVSLRNNTDNSIQCRHDEVEQQSINGEDKIQNVLEIEKVKVYSSHEIQNNEQFVVNQEKQVEEQNKYKQQVAFLSEKQKQQQKQQQFQPQQLLEAQNQQQLALQNKQFAGLVTPSARASGNYIDEKSPSNTQNDNSSRSQPKQANYETYSQNNNFEETAQNYDYSNTDCYQITPIQITKKGRQNQDAQIADSYMQNKNNYGRYEDKDNSSQDFGKIKYIHSLAYYDPLVNQKKIKKRGGQEEGNDVSLQDLLNQNQYSLASSVNFNYSISNYSSSKKQQRKFNATSSNYEYSEKLQERVEDRLLKMGHKKEEKLQKLRIERDQQFLQMTRTKSPDKNLYRQKQTNYQEYQSMTHQSLDQNQMFQQVGASLDSQFFQSYIQGQQQDAIQNQKYYQQQLKSLSQSQNFRETENSSNYLQNQTMPLKLEQTYDKEFNEQIIQNEAYQRLQGKKQLKYQFKPNIFSASQSSLVVNKRDEIKQNYLKQTKQFFSVNNTSQLQQTQVNKNSNGNQISSKLNSNNVLSNSSSPRTVLFQRQNVDENGQNNQPTNQNKQIYFNQQQQMRDDKSKVISTLYDSAQRQRQEQQIKEQEELNLQQQQYYQSYVNLTPQQVKNNNEQINFYQANQVQQSIPKEFSFNQSGLLYSAFQEKPSSDKMLFYSDKVQDLKLLQNYSPNFKSKYGAKYITQAGNNEYNVREYIRKIAQDCKQNTQFSNQKDYYQQNQ
ncbi:hypothetical protein TTHERM_00355310 (macronuclear) [Tetrahymena thermophila SB210]|uniref:Uncharacterized protein n=1 Tax=Tetrahymena thermophila (strain SB210) TaxID=312017 RepID=Q22Y40_TETTS|nr:hypothetical protein TTHERM_00355310 [Tetrahymena thermophila SB210]EAR90184.2 hypothetical protein TTHERM_00355310 [Tetrahymena thermophila SB210]|eukprot:XP_001010429.2 hypothetical protein TTHERM_00355310 [Tetrahymena thermophila SB210]